MGTAHLGQFPGSSWRRVPVYRFSLHVRHRDAPELPAVSAVLGVVPEQDHAITADRDDPLQQRACRLPGIGGSHDVARAHRSRPPDQDVVPRLEAGGHTEARYFHSLQMAARLPGRPGHHRASDQRAKGRSGAQGEGTFTRSRSRRDLEVSLVARQSPVAGRGTVSG